MKKAVTWGLLWMWVLTGIAQAEERWLPLPPESLAQWYKPHNKRQVWLHTMFALRREMQAVSEYAEVGDQMRQKEWTGRFVTHYRKIAEMVPEWKEELDYEWLQKLQAAVDIGDSKQVTRALKKLEKSCNSCHREYRATTALLYRAPDFSALKVAGELPGVEIEYGVAMQQLSTWVNRIKIAVDDDRTADARDALGQLNSGLNRLGESCRSCHSDDMPRERILGALTQGALSEVAEGLIEGDKKRVGRSLGSAAVYACARCHAIHRAPFDMRRRLQR